MTKLEEILTDVRQGSLDVDEARNRIRALFSSMLEEAVVGIFNVDATEMYGEMNRSIESA